MLRRIISFGTCSAIKVEGKLYSTFDVYSLPSDHVVSNTLLDLPPAPRSISSLLLIKTVLHDIAIHSQSAMSNLPVVLQLYREIRRLHRMLPAEMKFLGNVYVSEEGDTDLYGIGCVTLGQISFRMMTRLKSSTFNKL